MPGSREGCARIPLTDDAVWPPEESESFHAYDNAWTTMVLQVLSGIRVGGLAFTVLKAPAMLRGCR